MWSRAPSCELGVLEALGRVELAVGGGRVVEELGQRAGDVVVVVEGVGVVAARPAVPLHEDLIGGVDHDLPHVVVLEQLLQGAVADQVAQRPLGHRGGVAQGDGAAAPLVLEVPLGDLVVDQGGGARSAASGPSMRSARPAARSCTRRSMAASGDGSVLRGHDGSRCGRGTGVLSAPRSERRPT